MSRECYTEKHHIVPRSVYGKGILKEDHLSNVDQDENIVELTGREHFVAHWLLHRAFPKVRNFASAFHAMASMSNNHHYRYTPSSRAIEEARIAHANALKLPVAMYSKEGTLLEVFATTEEAAIFAGTSVHNIAGICGGREDAHTSGGYQWRRFEKTPKDKIEAYINPNEENSLSVHEYNLKGEYIKSYNSIRDAERNGVSRAPLKSKLGEKPIHIKDKWYVISEKEPEKSILVKKKSTQRRQVLQIDPKSGEVIKIWKSSREPQRVLGIHNVSHVCNGKRKTMGGFIWKYAEEDFELNLDEHKRGLAKANDFEVFSNGKSLGTFRSFRKAENELGISRRVLSKLEKSGKTNDEGLYVRRVKN